MKSTSVLTCVCPSIRGPVEPRDLVDDAPELGKERLSRRVLEARGGHVPERADLRPDHPLDHMIMRFAEALEAGVDVHQRLEERVELLMGVAILVEIDEREPGCL